MSTPFTILTGFLGAGKTTILNRMLGATGGRKIAVLVNELGRIAVDSKLILSRGGDVLELAGGCVCCKVDTKNDLWDGIADVIARSAPEHVVLETTGIAEPGAIIEGFRTLPPETQDCVTPVGIVSVVDALAGPKTVRAREEAREQIACADRLLISKLDLATPAETEEIHRVLDGLNDSAERASFPAGELASHELTNWLLLHKKLRGGFRSHTHSHGQGQLVAVSFAEEDPLVESRLLELVERNRERLYRVKGYVHLAESDERGYLELAGNQVSLQRRGSWGSDAPKTEVVLIGEDLNESALRRQLWACRAGHSEGKKRSTL